ncbi:CACTA en-spm transposon protein [Cucumis melo var. makuwa]|uniref:CACTA en-spm transposon protein n=1 Tax=Cucumis melo var. makuwa TaxID=1194695 RepID=A0A5D3DU76_CUCMM|nr:CACTA en-spm transposon protein [Cucumis melo var. makuwa]TYK26855.1 CACTA en-spm transposon protein [Cucumis melo var. makuwa]
MRWHRNKRVETNDVLRHPTDVEGWKHRGIREPRVRRCRLHDGKVERRALLVVMNRHKILEQLDQLEFPVMMDDVENEHLNVLEIVINHQVDEHIEDDTLCRTDVDPIIVERPIASHVTDDFIDHVDEHLSHASTMSSFPRTNFLETDAMFLEFEDNLNNLVGGSSSVGDNSGRFLNHLRLQLLEDVHSLDSKSWSTTQVTGMCMQKTFLIRCLKWANIGRKYIKIIKGDLQEQSRTNKAARQKQPYNQSSGSKSFLQRQHKLIEQRWESVYRVELFRKTNVRDGMFVSQAAEDVHHQMLELQSPPTREGSQPLSGDEICKTVLGRRSGYSKGLGSRPKSKAHKMTSASSSTTSCS